MLYKIVYPNKSITYRLRVSNFSDVQIVVVQWLFNGPVFRDHEPQERKGWAANKTVAPAWSSIEDAVWDEFVFSPLLLFNYRKHPKTQCLFQVVWWMVSMVWWSHFPPVGSCDSGLDAERWGLRQEPPGSVHVWLHCWVRDVFCNSC